jgi:uncharacterized membrane protein required for colicin V production
VLPIGGNMPSAPASRSPDHLLFVLALLNITDSTARLTKTITAFSVAQSITPALATLGFVHVPSSPVEAVIALSIVFVAVEIIHLRQGRRMSGVAVHIASRNL